MNYRTFIALEPPKSVFLNLKEKLNIFKSTQGVNWVKEQNLHLTLLFLGDVDSTRINELSGILEQATEIAADAAHKDKIKASVEKHLIKKLKKSVTEYNAAPPFVSKARIQLRSATLAYAA